MPWHAREMNIWLCAFMFSLQLDGSKKKAYIFQENFGFVFPDIFPLCWTEQPTDMEQMLFGSFYSLANLKLWNWKTCHWQLQQSIPQSPFAPASYHSALTIRLHPAHLWKLTPWAAKKGIYMGLARGEQECMAQWDGRCPAWEAPKDSNLDPFFPSGAKTSTLFSMHWLLNVRCSHLQEDGGEGPT